ncbi:MAG: cob(I)yrinic acid a,c-diamide adenosyltransferase [Deltaproteobacteria bacterium]|nr:cob(I)yrinic acid a,c-diamide adenosyltransferase [Deltaproteobacteria bacterium]
MKIYTRTGDDGTTGLFGGERVHKHDARVEAYGTVDELNSAIGLVRSAGIDRVIDGPLEAIQNELFVIGAEIACVPGKEGSLGLALIDESAAARLEGWIDEAEQELPPLKVFILPAGTPASAGLHVARTVARRAERALLAAHEKSPVRQELLVYLNRLSDLLFVLARRANHLAGVPDVPWKARSDSRRG